MVRFRTAIAVVCVLPLLVIGLGCYKTQFPLGSESTARVDPAYIGDYVLSDGKSTSTLVIRNIDNRLYYVEWTNGDDNKRDRMVGYTSVVNGVTFANLRDLTDDGSIENSFLIMRVALSTDHSSLALRNLKEEFFKDKNISSSDALEKVIAANVDNDEMYDGAAVVATRQAAPGAATNPSPDAPHASP